MADGRSDRRLGSTTIFAVIVLLLVGVVLFMILFWSDVGPAEEPASGPDVELEATPPDNGGSAPEGGDAGGTEGGTGEAVGKTSAGE